MSKKETIDPHYSVDRSHPSEWKYSSPTGPGLHTVISPENSVCKITWAFRLNINRNATHVLQHPDLELNAAVISGRVEANHRSGNDVASLGKFDSLYLPCGDAVELTAKEDSILYIGGGPDEAMGEYFVRPYDADLPTGEIHQLHGEPPFQREIFMTLNQETPASRMVNGFTWGAQGLWTSWPPHQHSADLEEVYCYFDIPHPRFALHLASRYPRTIEAVHPVSSGDFVVIPEGYHPTVGAPNVKSCYFWIMVAHSRKSRRYDLAKVDGGFTD